MNRNNSTVRQIWDETKQFFGRLGYIPNLLFPITYNEKITYKKLFDMNELLPVLCDKVTVRDYYQDVLGGMASNHLPTIIKIFSKDIVFTEEMLRKYGDCIIKFSNKSGINYISKDGNFNIMELNKMIESEKDKVYGEEKREWCYSKTTTKILVEKLIVSSGGAPIDIKFFMSYGKCFLIHVGIDRFSAYEEAYYTDKWGRIKNVNYRYIDHKDEIPRPNQLDEMLTCASALSKKLNFIRVDMFFTSDNYYLGEMTNYPQSGQMFFNKMFDFILGRKFRITTGNWISNCMKSVFKREISC